MNASIEATGAGTHVADPLSTHEARTAARRLIAGLFDAWDTGDTEAVVAHFAPDAVWSDPAGGRSIGHEALAGHFARWRGWEPFSVHWVSNEEVLATDDGLRGTWLWSAASNIDHGATAAWSGGDLAVLLGLTEEGWRIAELVVTDRYRTPYRAGWLDHLLVQPSVEPDGGARGAEGPVPGSGRLGVPLAGIDLAPLPGAVTGTTADRTAALEAETEVRWLIGEYSDAIEQGAPGAGELMTGELMRWWAEDGTYSSDVVTVPAVGEGALVAAHAAEADRASAWIRALMSLSIQVDGDGAACRWRDIWTAEVDGQARWLAHAYEARAVRAAHGWRLSALRRRALLDCSYQEGWTREVPGQTGRIAKETR